MNRHDRQRVVILIAMGCTFAAAIGCSKLRSSKRLNLGPFAEQMIAVAGDIQYGLAQEQPVYLRHYRKDPAVTEFLMRSFKVRAVVRGTISYSIETVTIGDSDLKGPQRAQAMANYLDGLLRPILMSPQPDLHLTIADLDTIITNVRAQKNLLDALGAAQPVIDEVAYSAGELFDEAKNALDDMLEYLRDKVDEEHADILLADRVLLKEQVSTVLGIGYIKAHREGDETAMDSLFAREPSILEVVKNPKNPSREDMSAIEQRLLFKLRSLREIRDQLTPDIELYWEKQKEIDRLSATYNAALRKATVAVLAWARAHARLAAGVIDPAEIDLLGIAKRAAGSATPIPIP